MKRKNDSNPKRHGKEDLGFLDDRMQLLETVREMINIELERRGMTPGGDPHPENPPPDDRGRKPSRPTAAPNMVAAHRDFLNRLPAVNI